MTIRKVGGQTSPSHLIIKALAKRGGCMDLGELKAAVYPLIAPEQAVRRRTIRRGQDDIPVEEKISQGRRKTFSDAMSNLTASKTVENGDDVASLTDNAMDRYPELCIYLVRDQAVLAVLERLSDLLSEINHNHLRCGARIAIKAVIKMQLEKEEKEEI